MAPTTPTIRSASSSSSSSGDEHEAEQRPTKNPPILPTDQEQEGDSYESDDSDEEEDVDEGEPVGASNVTAKRVRSPSPLPHLQGLPEPHTPRRGDVPSPKLTKPSPSKRTATAAHLAEPSPSKKKAVPSKLPPAAPGEQHHTKLQHMATPAKEVPKLPEKAVAVAAKKVAKFPEKAPTAKKVAKAPPLKKAAAAGARQAARNRKEVAKQPPASKAKAAAAAAVARQTAGKEVAYNAEKRLEERSETYWHLARVLKEVETKHKAPGLYNVVFLSIADDKAAMLNTKIKKQEMAEAKLYLKRHDITKEVIRVLSKLVK